MKDVSIPIGKWVGPNCTGRPAFAPAQARPKAVLPAEIVAFHEALQALKDAWLSRDLAKVPDCWKAALASAKAVQVWRMNDSRAQDVGDAKRRSQAARVRQEARVLERGLLSQPTWALDFLVTALGERMKPLLEYLAKLEDPAYAG